MLPMALMQVGSGIMSAYGAMQQQKERERIEEEYNRRAYAELQKSQDTAKNLNPQATGNAATARIMESQTAAMNQAANVGAGMAANSGLGGDVVANNISTAKAMQPIGAVAAQTGAQLAGIEQNVFNDQVQRQQTMADNASRIQNLHTGVNYNYAKKATMLDAVGGMMAGMNAGQNMWELATGKGDAMNTKGEVKADGSGAGAAAMAVGSTAPALATPVAPATSIPAAKPGMVSADSIPMMSPTKSGDGAQEFMDKFNPFKKGLYGGSIMSLAMGG